MAQSIYIIRRITRTGVDNVIYSELHRGQLFAHFFQSCYSAQYIRYDSICSFRLAIGLKMISGRNVKLATQQLHDAKIPA